MKMKYFLLGGFLFLGIEFCSAQFNTLTYSAPQRQEKKPTFQNEKIEEKLQEKEGKKKKKKPLLNITTKSQLKGEIDSLKMMIKDLKSSKNDMNRIKDSLLILNLLSKKNEPKNNGSLKSIRKYEFVKEAEFINKISMPLGNNLVVTSPYGVRNHPVYGGQKMHNGVDFKAGYENVYSVLDGIVSEAGWDDKGGGNYIKIRHSDKYETSYLHLSAIYYRVGESVRAGYIIGKSGNSGTSTGPHLHFAVKEFGKFVNPIRFLNDLIKVNNLISIQYEQQQFTNR